MRNQNEKHDSSSSSSKKKKNQDPGYKTIIFMRRFGKATFVKSCFKR